MPKTNKRAKKEDALWQTQPQASLSSASIPVEILNEQLAISSGTEIGVIEDICDEHNQRSLNKTGHSAMTFSDMAANVSFMKAREPDLNCAGKRKANESDDDQLEYDEQQDEPFKAKVAFEDEDTYVYSDGDYTQEDNEDATSSVESERHEQS